MELANIDFQKMPVLPQVLAGIMKLEDDNEVSFGELEKLIMADQSVSTLILKVANSPLYARTGAIKTLKHALSILGFKMVRSLIILASSKSLFQEGNYEKFRKYVWRHSITTAIVAKELAGRLNHKNIQEEAFVCGLLHDIGKVILNNLDRKKFIGSIALALEQKLSFRTTEHKLFGFDHLEVGAMAAKHWHLPEIFSICAALHEEYKVGIIQGENDTLLQIISFADFTIRSYEREDLPESELAEGKSIAKVLDISEAEVEYFSREYPLLLEKDEFYQFCTGIL